MRARGLNINGAWLLEGIRFSDSRGFFQEWFRNSALLEATGVDFRPIQANISCSSKGTIRGIHYSIAPAGQGKLVTVMHGAINDYVVDIRPGSPTFGKWQRVSLDSENGAALLIDPHLGHAFQALTDDTIVSYLVSAEYNPDMEKGITPFCPDLNIDWEPHHADALSPKDSTAAGLLAQRDAGLLPRT